MSNELTQGQVVGVKIKDPGTAKVPQKEKKKRQHLHLPVK